MGKHSYIRDILQYAGKNRADENSHRGHSLQFKNGTATKISLAKEDNVLFREPFLDNNDT